METTQYQVAAFLSDAFFPRSGQSYPAQDGRSHSLKNVSNCFLKMYSKTVVGKRNAISWFHFALNVQLFLWVLMSFYFEVSEAQLPVYYIVCLSNGWIFFFTLEKWVCKGYKMFSKVDATETPKNYLCQFAGRSLFSRSILLSILIVSIFFATSIHPAFAIITGTLLRWMIVCQVRAYNACMSGFDAAQGPIVKTKQRI